MTKTILILAANPREDLDLRREVHILKSVIQRSQAQDDFEIKIDSGINADQIQKLFLEHKPRIVHFCGHGAGEDGLRFEDKFVSNDALSDLFKHFANQIECVLLNACYSDLQATEISRHINYVIGMKQAIRDDSAIVFTRGFYETLGDQQSIEDAYNLGCTAIKLLIDNINDSSSDTSEAERNAYTPKRASKRRGEYLKPQLFNIKSPLTQFNDEDKSKSSKDFPDLTELVEYEIKRREYQKDREKDFEIGTSYPQRQLSRREYQYRKVLRSKVKEFWIEGVLEKSLFNQVLFEQELIEKPDAVNRPFSELEEFVVESDQSFEFIQASDIFEEMGAGRTLLILGEPGTGKTLSMLKLAERLIKKTEEDLTLPIPVVFNLSSWAMKRQNIEDWLAEELKDKYGVSIKKRKEWIEKEQLILLLDGLDEVKKEYRNDCINALNKFLGKHGITETVVCCRVQDYQALSERLNLRNAICIQPLSSEYINWYLDDVNDEVKKKKDPRKSLVGLKQLLQRDKELEEFARTPLIFSIMTFAYQGYSLKKLLEQMSIESERYKKLFDTYIEKMFERKDDSFQRQYPQYTKQNYNVKTKFHLSYLAKKIREESQSIFLIEKIQPNWLKKEFQNKIEKRDYLIYVIANLMSLLLIASLIMILLEAVGILTAEDIRQVHDYLGYLMSAVWFLFVFFFNEIKNISKEITLFENISWSWQSFQSSIKLKYLFIIGLVIGLNSFLIIKLRVIENEIIFTLLVLMQLLVFISCGILFLRLISELFTGLANSIIKGYERNTTCPNQGIWNSGKNFLSVGIISGLITYFVVTVISGFLCMIIGTSIGTGSEYSHLPGVTIDPHLFLTNINEGFKCVRREAILRYGWSLGLVFGLVMGLKKGGFTCIQHFILRLILCRKDYITWNYANFLDYATERLFMQKVGGGYIFIHRMLMEHFANMKLDKTSRQ